MLWVEDSMAGRQEQTWWKYKLTVYDSCLSLQDLLRPSLTYTTL